MTMPNSLVGKVGGHRETGSQGLQREALYDEVTSFVGKTGLDCKTLFLL